MGEEDKYPMLHLQGADLDTVNHTAIGIVVGVVGAGIVGLTVDHCLRPVVRGSKYDRPRGWVIGTLVGSYALLIPGLTMTLFSFQVAAVNGLYTIRANTETMLEFVGELWESGALLGASCIVLFAIVIPIVKIILLCIGGTLRHSTKEGKVTFAGTAIRFVQKISKWASPDMFAYILFLNLVRGLNHPPTLNGLFRLDVGFSCFSVFCIASTISSLGVRSPPVPITHPEISSRFSKKVVAMIVTVIILFLVFLYLLYHGLRTPCMALRLDINKLFETGEIAANLRPIVEMLHIGEKAASDISMSETMTNLWSWAHWNASGEFHYEANCFLAWMMIAVFVVAFTIFDMIALIILAFQVRVQVKHDGHRPKWAMEVVHVLRKLSMLDVTVVGVCIIILAGQIYKEMGIMLTLRGGIVYLAFAELCHYVVYFLVTSMAEAMPALEVEPLQRMTEEFSENEDEESSSSSSSGKE